MLDSVWFTLVGLDLVALYKCACVYTTQNEINIGGLTSTTYACWLSRRLKRVVGAARDVSFISRCRIYALVRCDHVSKMPMSVGIGAIGLGSRASRICTRVPVAVAAA